MTEEPKAAALAPKLFPDYGHRAAIMERRSAVRWADRITVPLLIMHGGADTNVDPAHPLQLAAAMQRNGNPYEIVIVAGARPSSTPELRVRLAESHCVATGLLVDFTCLS